MMGPQFLGGLWELGKGVVPDYIQPIPFIAPPTVDGRIPAPPGMVENL